MYTLCTFSCIHFVCITSVRAHTQTIGAAGKLVGKITKYTYTLYSDASIHASIFAHLFPFIFDKELQSFRQRRRSKHL